MRRNYGSNQSYISANTNYSSSPISFDDDEEIQVKDLTTQSSESGEQKQFDLEKKVRFSLDLHTNSINLSQLTDDKIITQPLIACIDVDEIQLDSKASIDLVCILDVSGSMSGEKIDLLKKSVITMLGYLGENDRISLVTFNSTASRLCPLLRLTEQNKNIVTGIIQKVSAGGSTQTAKGFDLAMQVLASRKFVNNVTGLMLLSDGVDDNGKNCYTAINNILVSYQEKINGVFSINTFGFGADHDEETLTNIAKLRDGSFYFVDKLDTVDEYFVSCLGGLISVVAQNNNIIIKPNFDNKVFDIKITKAFGAEGFWESKRTDNSFNANVIQLISGRKTNFVFEVEIKLKESVYPEDQIEILSFIGQLELNGLKESGFQKTQKTAELFITLNTEDKPLTTNIPVVIQYYRVKLAGKISEGMNLADQDENRKAQTLLSEFKSEIESLISTQKQFIKEAELMHLLEFIQQLETSILSAEPKTYSMQGKKMMYEQCDYHTREKANVKSKMCSNSIQSAMINKVQQSKK